MTVKLGKNEQQLELIEELDLDAINRQLDTLSDDDHQWAVLHWPERLQTLYQLVLRELQVLTFDDGKKHRLASKIITAMANYQGGRELYLPRNDKLIRALRDLAIFNQFTGNNIAQLAKEYELTDRAVYIILAEQRKVQLNRRQKSLF